MVYSSAVRSQSFIETAVLARSTSRETADCDVPAGIETKVRAVDGVSLGVIHSLPQCRDVSSVQRPVDDGNPPRPDVHPPFVQGYLGREPLLRDLRVGVGRGDPDV
jgi:hypothetical protein